jgi:outer membrane lipoprotein LolB
VTDKPAASARATRFAASLIAVLLLSACAAPRPPDRAGEAVWSGRLALRIDSTPAQSFSAGFDLRGSPDAGELQLTSPLGTSLATVQWSPQGAELRQGGKVERRASLDELSTEITGTALPVAAMFGWLRGDSASASADGWTVDLSQQPEGRITARRTTPPPSAELRLLFAP